MSLTITRIQHDDEIDEPKETETVTSTVTKETDPTEQSTANEQQPEPITTTESQTEPTDPPVLTDPPVHIDSSTDLPVSTDPSVTTNPTEPPVSTETATDPIVQAPSGAEGGVGGMSAVVIGGTGAVGRALVSQLLANKTVCNKVTVFGRRDINSVLTDVTDETHDGRLVQCIGDLDSLTDDTIKTNCTGANVFFSSLGTTRRAAGSAQEFYRIDHDLVVRFARLAKEVDVSHFSLVSSYGANPNSMFLYTRTKGEVEQSVQGLGFPYTTVLRPGVLGRGTEARFAEKVVGFILRAIPVTTVAQAMINDAYQYYTAKSSANNSVILTNSDIYRIAANENSTN